MATTAMKRLMVLLSIMVMTTTTTVLLTMAITCPTVPCSNSSNDLIISSRIATAQNSGYCFYVVSGVLLVQIPLLLPILTLILLILILILINAITNACVPHEYQTLILTLILALIRIPITNTKHCYYN